MKVGLKCSNAWYINYMRICYELTVRNDLRTYHNFTVSFPKNKAHVETSVDKKTEKKISTKIGQPLPSGLLLQFVY